MTQTDIFPWHQSQWQIFSQYFNQNRLPQALLIHGNKGLGKQHLAYAFASALLCPNRLSSGHSCGKCARCQLVQASTHPDLMTVQAKEEGKGIGIDLIRTLIEKLTLKPQFEMSRVVVIQMAESLNTSAANAFLKCLEEPNERTCLILVVEQPSKLPATILSRCQKISLTNPSKTEAYEWLKAQGVFENCEVLLTLALGAPLLAKDYFKMEVLSLRKSCFDDWMALSDGRGNPIQIAEHWAKQSTILLIDWLISWTADLIKCCHKMQASHLYNPDFQSYFQALAPQLEEKALFTFYECLLKRRKIQGTPINSQLMFEELLILWLQLTQRN